MCKFVYYEKWGHLIITRRLKLTVQITSLNTNSHMIVSFLIKITLDFVINDAPWTVNFNLINDYNICVFVCVHANFDGGGSANYWRCIVGVYFDRGGSPFNSIIRVFRLPRACEWNPLYNCQMVQVVGLKLGPINRSTLLAWSDTQSFKRRACKRKALYA